jgi:1,4-alpha-glucan branching enzyme
MLDHTRFTRELVGLRWQYPALRGQGFRVVYVHDQNRVLAFHRWVEGDGRDVMVVVHLSTFTRVGYRIGFRSGREWREVFNSDVYDNRVNPHVAADSGRVVAELHPMHDFSHSATLVLPADSLLVFAR